jgi:hypothetical protein
MEHISEQIYMNAMKLFSQIQHFINYLYYFNFSLSKNTYPCKLIGEKILPNTEGILIIFKLSGIDSNYEISLRKLLNDKKLLEKFHPCDAFQLGLLSFEEIIRKIDKQIRLKTYINIKNMMLGSVHDVYPIKSLDTEYPINHNPNDKDIKTEDILTKINFMKISNKYPYKLVNQKCNSADESTFIKFTVFGKREGYEKQLIDITKNKGLLSKFHPTETVKLGFISGGESFLKNEIKFSSTNFTSNEILK